MNGDLLLEAHTLVNGQRQKDYGRPEDSFRRIAALWSAYLGADVSGKDVALMMALLKLSRESNAHKMDNLLDCAAYVALGADMALEGASHEDSH